MTIDNLFEWQTDRAEYATDLRTELSAVYIPGNGLSFVFENDFNILSYTWTFLQTRENDV